jgi:flagellar hook-length control protein FliK
MPATPSTAAPAATVQTAQPATFAEARSVQTSAAQRLDGIDRLLTLGNATRQLVGTAQAQPTTGAGGQATTTGATGTGAQLPAAPISGQNAATAAPLPTAAQTATSRAVAGGLTGAHAAVSAAKAAVAPTALQASGASAAAPSAFTSTAPTPADNAFATPTTAQAFAQATETADDEAATADLASPLTPATTSGATSMASLTATLAAQTLGTTTQAGRSLLQPHESGSATPSAETGLRSVSGVQGALISGGVTGAQAGAQTSADTGEGGDLPQSSSGQPEALNPTVGPGATTSQAATNVGSSGATAAGSSATTSDQSQLIAQVTRHIETMRLRNGQGEITVKLSPDQLGSVRLTVTNHADGVTARIVTETAQAQHAMANAGQQLHSALEARGLKLTAFDVSLGNGATDAGASNYSGLRDTAQDQATRAFSSQRNSGRGVAAVGDSTPETAAVAEPGRSTLNGSSRLDYRA